MRTIKSPSQNLNVNGQAIAKLTYRVREAQDASGLSRSTIYKLIAEEKLKTTKVGSCLLIVGDSLRALLSGQ